jgi:hypothetical protein
LRRVSAWALPRPSAIASAKFAKTTVNQSQSVIWTRNLIDSPSVPVKMSTVVIAAPTSVTNMTGFLTMWTGFSFLKDSPIAGMTMVGSKMDSDLAAILT